MTSDQRIPRPVSDRASHWITARDAGTMSGEQEAELALWLAADPLHARAYAEMADLWGQLGEAPFRAAMADTADTVVVPLPVSRTRGWQRPWAGSAMAACLALVAIGIAQDWPTRWRADMRTEVGQRRAFALEDGSRVMLDTDSAIAVDYRADRRIVRLLKGEAAFTVAPDRNRPFTVAAAGGTATALGTRFIVRREGDGTGVTVTEHVVRVSVPTGVRRSVDVREGQGLRYGAAGLSPARAVDVRTASAWTRGLLLFDNRPLGEVVAELDRYHPGYIHVVGQALARRPVSGGFRTDDPVHAIDDLQQMLDIRSVRMTDRLIFLHD